MPEYEVHALGQEIIEADPGYLRQSTKKSMMNSIKCLNYKKTQEHDRTLRGEGASIGGFEEVLKKANALRTGAELM